MSNGLKAVAGAAAWKGPGADASAAAGRPAAERPCALWERVRREAEREREREPALGEFLDATILHRKGLEDALVWILSRELASPVVGHERLREIFDEVHTLDPGIGDGARADLQAVRDRDPALDTYFPACCSSRGTTPSRRTASPIGSGTTGGSSPPSSCKAAWRVPTGWTSTLRQGSGAAS